MPIDKPDICAVCNEPFHIGCGPVHCSCMPPTIDKPDTLPPDEELRELVEKHHPARVIDDDEGFTIQQSKLELLASALAQAHLARAEAGLDAELRELVVAPCTSGCGCVEPDDADRRECACDGPCCFGDFYTIKTLAQAYLAQAEALSDARAALEAWAEWELTLEGADYQITPPHGLADVKKQGRDALAKLGAQ